MTADEMGRALLQAAKRAAAEDSSDASSLSDAASITSAKAVSIVSASFPVTTQPTVPLPPVYVDITAARSIPLPDLVAPLLTEITDPAIIKLVKMLEFRCEEALVRRSQAMDQLCKARMDHYDTRGKVRAVDCQHQDLKVKLWRLRRDLGVREPENEEEEEEQAEEEQQNGRDDDDDSKDNNGGRKRERKSREEEASARKKVKLTVTFKAGGNKQQ